MVESELLHTGSDTLRGAAAPKPVVFRAHSLWEVEKLYILCNNNL